ncbi:MAG: endonuclease/exonuclease/phosphatase family protein [Helicobacteraceae bacterium]|nr:endonuclease/exonuclease/phosphatase family protein [Helicobacteraceae bacterium]
MLKPQKTLKLLNHQNEECANSFTLLNWNIAKESQNSAFQNYLQEIITDEKVDFIALQEVKEHLSQPNSLKDFSYVISANMQTSKHIFGVLNAFKFSCTNHTALLSSVRELKYATHKSSLITEHKLQNSSTLKVVNLHAINFVSSQEFKKELKQIMLEISSYSGALIVTGDFNTWSTKRLQHLKEFIKDLSLIEVNFQSSQHIKQVFSKSLDYVFYRGLKVENSKVIKCEKHSDHNPMVVSFRVL